MQVKNVIKFRQISVIVFSYEYKYPVHYVSHPSILKWHANCVPPLMGYHCFPPFYDLDLMLQV